MGKPLFRSARQGGETGSVRKEWGGKKRVALVYPNAYRLAMSNLGFLLVHGQVNERPDRLCERAFLSPVGGRKPSTVSGGRCASPLIGATLGRTLESGRFLSEFDVVAISLSFENDLLNIPDILAAGGILPFREDRAASGKRYPLVVAGGFAASLNPEPCGVFADAVIVGDGERAVEALLDMEGGDSADAGFMRALSSIPGVYVPSGYVPVYERDDGASAGGRLLSLDPLPGFPDRVVRETLDLAALAPPPPIVLADDTEFGRMSLVETSRGCPKKCCFCAASHANPVFREFPIERVRVAAEAAWPHRRAVGMIGAAVLDWGPFREFALEVLERGGSVSPASVRAEAVDEEIADILARSGHRTVALAPECGDKRLRARVGKHISDDAFFDAASILARAGIVSFKLYFLIGLPGTQREGETEAIVGFLSRFREHVLGEARVVGRMGTITAVLSPFVPKPFTPLQWAGMAKEEELIAREKIVASFVRTVPNLRCAGERPRDAVLQGYLGLSDRRVAEGLRKVKGGRFHALPPEISARISAIAHREKNPDEFFPWDMIEGSHKKADLRARYEKYLQG
ncbi:MAG: B12-binding domain-containing radical SAM protein [Syntrophorhabdaceae bacterium]|nr:B12-binding domain-containing radical SAM protein [Syntrophorhabdaceae bacterium]